MTVRRMLRWVLAIGAIAILAVPALVLLLGLRQPRALTLPGPTGPYPVGRLVEDWRDDSRVDPFAPAGTKRELPVWIWYPAAAQPGRAPAVYMPARLRDAMQPSSSVVRFVMGRITTDRANVTGHAIDAPPVAAADRPFPVLLLKPALGAAAVQNSVLAEDLASHGYVVVGTDSPHTTPAVVYQDGRVVVRTAAGHPPENAPGPISDLAPGQPNDFYLPVLDVWVDDNRFVLDRLEALNAGDPTGRFTARLDLAAVGAFGHSLGGATGLQFCREDPPAAPASTSTGCRLATSTGPAWGSRSCSSSPTAPFSLARLTGPTRGRFSTHSVASAHRRRRVPTCSSFGAPSISTSSTRPS